CGMPKKHPAGPARRRWPLGALARARQWLAGMTACPDAATAITWSLSAGTAPETPTAPRSRPSEKSGTPPLPKTNWYPSSAATLPAKSWRALNRASRSWVLDRKAAAALALARAISGVTQSAPSIRWQATRCPASSTTAMATRKPSSSAFASPLSMHSMAVVSVTIVEPPLGCPRVSGHVHEDVVAVDANRVGRNGGATRGKGALARPDIEHPAVPGTGEPGPAELALAQRAASMRADIATGID